jgi:hypothetical protein
MSDERISDERISDEGSVSVSVLRQLIELKAQVTYLAKQSDVKDLEKSIEVWKREMGNEMHIAISGKVKKAVGDRHDMCKLERDAEIKEVMDEHVDKFHARTSQIKNKKSGWEQMAPVLVKLLPYIIAALGLGGGGLIAANNSDIVSNDIRQNVETQRGVKNGDINRE